MSASAKWIMILSALALSMGTDARQHDWGWSEPRWRVMHDGFGRNDMRIEKAAYDLDASLLLSRRCMGFALPPAALQFFEGESQATVDWRVDRRKTRYGVFLLFPTRRGLDVCAADTIVKDWEKRFAEDVMGIDDDAFMAEPPRVLTVRFRSPTPHNPGDVMETSFDLDGVRSVACRHEALPKKQLHTCYGVGSTGDASRSR